MAVGILLLSYLENFPTQILFLSAVWRSATQMKLCWICEKETCRDCTAASVKYQLNNARISTSNNPCPCLGHTQLWAPTPFCSGISVSISHLYQCKQGLLKSSGHALYLHTTLFLRQNRKPKTILHLILKLSYPLSFVPLCRQVWELFVSYSHTTHAWKINPNDKISIRTPAPTWGAP